MDATVVKISRSGAFGSVLRLWVVAKDSDDALKQVRGLGLWADLRDVTWAGPGHYRSNIYSVEGH